MNNEAVQKWIDALRSGEYKQTVGGLCRLRPGPHGEQVGYCCLGVACEVYQKEFGTLEIKTNGGLKTYNSYFGYLPEVVSKWLGFFDDLYTTDTFTLSRMNDDYRCTFEEIAEHLEESMKHHGKNSE